MAVSTENKRNKTKMSLTSFIYSGSDRRFWDGWVSKAMFMAKNGKYTRKNVRIQKGESICVAVLVSWEKIPYKKKRCYKYNKLLNLAWTNPGRFFYSSDVTLCTI